MRPRRHIAIDAPDVHSIWNEAQVYAMRAFERIGRLDRQVRKRAGVGEVEFEFGRIGHRGQAPYFFASASISGTPRVSINSPKRRPVIGRSMTPVSLSWRIASRMPTNAAISVPV